MLQRAPIGSSRETSAQMEMMREEIGRMAKNELGRVAADAVEEYFPQEAKARRRRSAWRAFVVGLALGVVGRYALRRRTS